MKETGTSGVKTAYMIIKTLVCNHDKLYYTSLKCVEGKKKKFLNVLCLIQIISKLGNKSTLTISFH